MIGETEMNRNGILGCKGHFMVHKFQNTQQRFLLVKRKGHVLYLNYASVLYDPK